MKIRKEALSLGTWYYGDVIYGQRGAFGGGDSEREMSPPLG